MSSESHYFVEQTDFSIRFARGVNQDGALVLDQIVEVPLADAATLSQHITPGRPVLAALRPKDQKLVLADADLAKKHAGLPGIAAWARSARAEAAWLSAVQSKAGQIPTESPWLVSAATAEGFQQALALLEPLSAKPTRCISATITTAGALAAVAEKPVLFLELGETVSHAMVISRDGVLANAEIAVNVDRIAEAVQSELNLKFRGSALKLFLNPDYDFSDVAANIATKFAAVLQPAITPLLAQSEAPATIFCGGLPAKQQWFIQPLAAALNLPVRVTDVRSWCERNGVKFTRELSNAALSPAWFGFFHFIRASAAASASEPWQAEWLTVDTAAKSVARETVAASKPAPAPVAAPVVAAKPTPVPSTLKPTPAPAVPTPVAAAAQTAVKVTPKPTPAVAAVAAAPAAPVATAAPAALKPAAPAPAPKAAATTPAPAAKAAPSAVGYSTKPAPAPKNPPTPTPPGKQPPSAPAPKSISPEPAGARPSTSSSAPRAKSKAPLMIAAIVLVVVAIGAFFFFKARSDEAALVLQKQQTEARVKAEQEKARLAEQKAQEEAEARRKMEAELAVKLSAAEDARHKAEAEAQAQVQARLANARGSLVIATEPAGALVTVGALPARRTPVTFHDLKIGHYSVVINLPRYEEKRLDFEIQENVTNEPPVITLVRLAGSMELTSQPAGAQYEVHPSGVLMVAPEDRHTGTTPATLNDLPPGEYEVKFTREGWAPHVETISIAKNETAHLTWTFPNGVAKIESSPAGATVLRDGAKLGVTPLTLTDLPAGDVHYELALENFDSIQVNGRIENGATLGLSGTFRPEDRYYSVNELDHKPEAGNNKQPELPYYLTLENGKVDLELVVTRDGSTRDIRVINTTNKDLNKFCLAALSKWQFKPGTKNGAPVNTRMTVPFVFKAVKQ
jgi:TonB family protein